MLLTKIHIPTLGRDHIQRPGLLEMISAGMDRKLILVSAPAGFGKTTALVDWIRRDQIPTVWFSIDENDNDPVEFLITLISGIQRINKEAGKNALELLHSEQRVNRGYILEILINDLMLLEKDFLVVLDDFHMIEAKEILGIVASLIEHSPQQCHITISTRSDPALPLARLRSRGELLEIRTSELVFSAKDIHQLFNKKLKLGISDEDVLLLETKTEGWIAGLQLTALSVRDRDNVSAFIKELVGDHRYIMDYLIEEVLNSRDANTRDFLIKSSILAQVSAPLCDHVLQSENSQVVLESLEQDNMFIIPLDDSRQWYRYHHLFGDLLRQRLIQHSRDTVKELHNRASMWFSENGKNKMAIDHALKAENYSRAMQLIDHIGIDDIQWDIAQYSSILKFGSLFPDETILSNKRFCIFYSWMLTLYGRLEDAEKYLVQLEEIILREMDGSPEENKDLLGKLYIVIHSLYTYSGNADMAHKYSELALENVIDADAKWKAWAYISHGESCLLRSEIARASKSFSSAVATSERANSLYLKIVAAAKLAFTLKLEGRLKEAFRACEQGFDMLQSESPAIRKSLESISAFIQALKGNLLVEWNLADQGLELALEAYRQSSKASDITLLWNISLQLVEAWLNLGEAEKSLEVLKELRTKDNTSLWQQLHSYTLMIRAYTLDGETGIAESLLDEWAKRERQIEILEPRFLQFSRATIHIARYEMKEALALLDELTGSIQESQSIDLAIKVEVMRSKALHLLQEKQEATDALEKALIMALPGGYIRTFIDGGKEVEEVLKDFPVKQKLKDYVRLLLGAFKTESPEGRQRDKILSSRELETLALLEFDQSNQEIADKLFVSLNTVKTRLKNIYLKLEVDNRRKAVEKGKSLGLI